MVDARTQKKLQVTDVASEAGPFLRIPAEMLPEVQARLNRHNIFHWPDSVRVSLDGVNFAVYVNFGHKGNAAVIQAALDEPD